MDSPINSWMRHGKLFTLNPCSRHTGSIEPLPFHFYGIVHDWFMIAGQVPQDGKGFQSQIMRLNFRPAEWRQEANCHTVDG
mmetsp:Transcript_133045/g.230758  ORF Transcript_133045/g.230758 Transcript_133045/m.230758 type:complete len:81 (+) Transcript_133045:804-1046(+)